MKSELHYQKLANCTLAYRLNGSGEPLLLIHGYPLNSLTYRHVVPFLQKDFTCCVPDLLGAGETDWSRAKDFGFTAQAHTLKAFVDTQKWSSYSIVGHDTGGTIARKLALIDSVRVRQMALIGTEIPNHRPPWIERFQKTANPNVTLLFRTLMRFHWFRHSNAAFKGCFYDPRLIDGEFFRVLIAPAIASAHRTSGLIHYLLGIDWRVVDGLEREHALITAPTLLIWGAADTVFPVKEARAMITQLGNCKGFVTIRATRLFAHEERPETVAAVVRDFMTNSKQFGFSMKFKVGDTIPPFGREAIDGTEVSLPDPSMPFVLLHFSRWAGCPICNMHLASFRRRANDLNEIGIRVVMVFHSPAKDVRELRGDLPFTLIADSDGSLYRAFGVGRSILFAAYPKAFRALRLEAAKGNRAQRIHGGVLGLPADFLIDNLCQLLAVHYGVHANDSLEVDEVIRLAVEATG